MHAMILEAPGTVLRQAEMPLPHLGDHDILLKVKACGVCRTDLHILDGDLSEARYPLIPGHEMAINFSG